MHIFLFIAYGIVLTLAVMRMPFIAKSHIRPIYLAALFWLRACTSFVHNWVAYRYYPNHGDIWDYFNNGLQMKQELLHTPFSHFLHHYFPAYEGFHFNEASVWNQVSLNLVSAIDMVLGFLSFDNFYINSLLFSFLVFLGSIALYRVLLHAFSNRLLCALPVLLLPSTLFWTACLHKEALLYLLLGFLLLYWQRQLQQRFTVKGILTCIFLGAGLLLVRSNLLFGLFPGLLIWTLAEKTNLKWYMAVGIAILSLTGLFVIAGELNTNYKLFTLISEAQHSFYSLQGKSRIYLPVLQPTAFSFLQVLPYAVINGFFEPLPGHGGQLIYNFFSLELLLIWAIVIISCYVAIFKKKRERPTGFAVFCLVLVVIQLLLTGYIVPFIGALVRYRSIYLPFLLGVALYYLRSTALFTRLEEGLKKRTNRLINKKIYI